MGWVSTYILRIACIIKWDDIHEHCLKQTVVVPQMDALRNGIVILCSDYDS